MRHHLLLIFIAGLAASVLHSCDTEKKESETKMSFEIGFARVNVTPPIGIPLFGQLFPYAARGVESDLFANAMYIGDGNTEVLLVSCDVCIIPNDMVREICKRAEEITGVPSSNIIVSATHTHSGPVTDFNNALIETTEDELVNDYCVALISNIVEALKQAHDRADKGKLTLGYGELPGYGFNRRFIMSDGTIQTHPLKLDPHIVRPEGPDSKDLFVFCGYNTGGNPIGAAVNFACHATVMERNNEMISADYPGKVCDFINEKLGPGTVSLFLQGTAGNICQVNPLDDSRMEFGLEWTKEMGRAIGSKAIEMIKKESIETSGPLRIIARAVEVPRRKIDLDLASWAFNYKEVSAEPPGQTNYGAVLYDQIQAPVKSLEDIFDTPYWANIYAKNVKTQLEDKTEKSEFILKVIAQDNWALVSFPGEFFIEFGNAIREKSPFEKTVVVGYANGSNWYIPTKQAFRRPGGYETNVGTALFAPEAGEMVVEAAISMLMEVSNH